MRVAVLGAGAIGAYVGASLCRAGVEVHLVARGPHLAAMRQHGVQVRSPRGDFQARPYATDKPEEIGPVDHVFLGLKANAYAAAGPLVEPLLGPHTTVIGAQNGIPWWYFYGLPGPYQGRRIESVDPGGAVTKVLPLHRAIGCVVYPATVIESPGVVRHLEGTRFSIGEPDRTMSTRCSEFSAAMIAGGLKCPVEQDLRNDIWIKLMGNIAFNPISALTRATMAGICRHKGAKELVATMMEETLEVARLVGAQPDVSIERRLAGAEKTGEHKTSTLQDLERGRPMELDVLLNATVEIADMVGADVPTLRAISAVADLLNQSVAAAS
ncbi:MAG TPA: 2-dehydropantoate 2-reductase [Pseudonocardia sp.]|jgi:2-dehydropantoate 2-reductase|uniref:2-dehydropantoate 2-reductase n=1 Tax=Pseudonocardia sp. TaxID=60912 RepID=UPI002C0F58FC|nr:2-dehydropantoate 2-reductase [Pseudonocardia sp.]HTF48850.1 2-dehydropantoate 2-reductase [Pseudonocardia sp.]